MLIQYGAPKIGIRTDATGRSEVSLPIPLLGERSFEQLPLNAPSSRISGSFRIWEDENFLFGFTSCEVTPETDSAAAQTLYEEAFAASQGAELYRTWNYLPKLNDGEGDQERYRQFCNGRSLAFHKAFGSDEATYMPAGTCVGIDGDALVVCFLAGKEKPDHHENPQQVPAYRYPRQYGPQSPSFARATSVHIQGQRYRFVSGTAAVLGHESVGHGDISEQLKVTCDNLEIISKQAQVGQPALPQAASQGSGKVYLREAKHFELAKSYLETRFPSIAPSLVFLRSDICRKELLVEIELSYIDAPLA